MAKRVEIATTKPTERFRPTRGTKGHGSHKGNARRKPLRGQGTPR